MNESSTIFYSRKTAPHTVTGDMQKRTNPDSNFISVQIYVLHYKFIYFIIV